MDNSNSGSLFFILILELVFLQGTLITSTQASSGAPTAPRNLKLVVDSSTEITASWLEPLKLNGVLRRYARGYVWQSKR